MTLKLLSKQVGISGETDNISDTKSTRSKRQSSIIKNVKCPTLHENRIPSARGKRMTIHDLTNPCDATASIIVSHDILIENNHY